MKIHRDEESLLSRGGRPTLADLLEKMTFSPSKGTIDLNGARMVLTRTTFGADLQDELVRRYGDHEAMVLLLRLGYRNGREDAEFIRRAWPNLDVGDAFTAGTRLHMVTGTVRVETLHNDFDFRNDRFSGDFLWHDSVEAREHQRRHGRATKPVCWAQTGYAAGYASVFFRKLILYKEVSCAAMGDKSCRVVGKTVDDWGKDDPFVRTFLDEVLVTRAETPSRQRRSDLTRGQDAQTVLEDMIVAPVRTTLERLARTGLSTIITGPEGAGCFKAAAWLHASRFPSGHLHRRHALSPALPELIRTIRQTLAKKGSQAQTLVIEAVEDLGVEQQLDLVDLLQTEGAPPESLLVVGVSHLSLPELAARGTLRADFLHALSVLPVAMPALAARGDDISLFGDVYLSHLTARQTEFQAHLSPAARNYIRRQPWPGNLPELRSTVLRAALAAAEPEAITDADLAAAAHVPPVPKAREDDVGTEALLAQVAAHLDQGVALDDLTTLIERQAVEDAAGNISAAARRLGMTRAQLDYRLKARGRT